MSITDVIPNFSVAISPAEFPSPGVEPDFHGNPAKMGTPSIIILVPVSDHKGDYGA